jgi:hypothetical protein
MKSQVNKPIFIVGSGRSGTTLLYRLLSGHPELAYFTRLTNRFPDWPQLSLMSRLIHKTGRKFFGPDPESVNIFDYCGIDNDLLRKKGAALTETDVTDTARASLRSIILKHQKWMGKKRFINKNTSNTLRIRYLKEIFADALFVHIIRNGYAVVNSLYNVAWWADLELWWLGKTPRQWEKSGGNPFELCALHWKRQVEEILAHKIKIPSGQYIECRYENLVTNPQKTLSQIISSCELEWNPEFQNHIERVGILSKNHLKWQNALDNNAKEIVKKVAGDLIVSLGYDLH